MATKVKKPAKTEKRKSTEAPVKATKAAAKAELAPPVAVVVDQDELDEQEDASAAAASSSGGSAEALAAATSSPTEMSASFKNFRHHPDMENFYRFIYENDLRHEALAIIDEIMVEKQNKRLLKATKLSAH